MKKGILILLISIVGLQFANAQVSYGFKGGINVSSPKDLVTEDGSIDTDMTNKSSYHAGLWMRAKLPIVGFFVRPEVMYTSISTSIPTLGDYTITRIDAPVLIGSKVFGIGSVFAGPVFQYAFQSDLDEVDFEKIKSDDFYVGLQVGVGVELLKFGLDIRYETAFSDNVANFENNTNSYSIDNSPNQIIVGLSYRF